MQQAGKIFALAAVVGIAAGFATNYFQDHFNEAADAESCAQNEWSCSTYIPRVISDRTFQYSDEESDRLGAIIGKDTYEGLNMCDRAIVIHMEMEVARTRVVAEFANQFKGADGGSAQVEWTPPSADDLFANFKHVADNNLGFHCGAADSSYFAEGNEEQYDQVLRQYAQGAKFDYLVR